MITPQSCNDLHAWIATLLPESATTFIHNLKTKDIQPSSLLRMNVNHISRLGLDKACADILYDALHSNSLHSPSTSKDTALSEGSEAPKNQWKSVLRPFTTVAIIGTAGRSNTAAKMSGELFRLMCAKAETIIEQDFGLQKENVRLISGGAAWAGKCVSKYIEIRFYACCAFMLLACIIMLLEDHVAVQLHMSSRFEGLQLFLPCKWQSSPPTHEDNGSANWKSNPGRSANRYHHEFSAALGENTLEQIQRAQEQGAVIVDGTKGFHARNTHVAASDYMIAFTWASGSKPDVGGTLDTWNKCKSSRKVHVPLTSLSEKMYTQTGYVKIDR